MASWATLCVMDIKPYFRAHNPKVVGSCPSGSTFIIKRLQIAATSFSCQFTKCSAKFTAEKNRLILSTFWVYVKPGTKENEDQAFEGSSNQYEIKNLQSLSLCFFRISLVIMFEKVLSTGLSVHGSFGKVGCAILTDLPHGFLRVYPLSACKCREILRIL